MPNVSKLIVSLADIIKNNKCIATPVVQADKNEILDENIVKCAASFKTQNQNWRDWKCTLF